MHQHEPEECNAAFASWLGFESPLRHGEALGSCLEGGHRIWWTIQAANEAAAFAQLPPYVAQRTELAEVRKVAIP